jgi:yecA family protein
MEPNTAHDEIANSLARLQVGLGASELHGSLAGFLCAGGVAHRESWLAELALDEVAESVAESEEREVFVRLFESLAVELDDPDLGFELLLPSDDAPMEERTTALVDWCRGFLGGVGLSGVDLTAGLEGDLGEVLGDFGRIAASGFQEGDSAEDDEEAFAEVVEYVRVGALLVRTELSRAPNEATRH